MCCVAWSGCGGGETAERTARADLVPWRLETSQSDDEVRALLPGVQVLRSESPFLEEIDLAKEFLTAVAKGNVERVNTLMAQQVLVGVSLNGRSRTVRVMDRASATKRIARRARPPSIEVKLFDDELRVEVDRYLPPPGVSPPGHASALAVRLLLSNRGARWLRHMTRGRRTIVVLVAASPDRGSKPEDGPGRTGVPEVVGF